MLAIWLAIRAAKRRSAALAGCGISLGLAISARSAAVVTVPPIGVYLAANFWPGVSVSRLAAAKRLCFGGGTVLLVSGMTNFTADAGRIFRYTATGVHHASAQAAVDEMLAFVARPVTLKGILPALRAFVVHLYGLLLSPGKGLLWYSPPLLAGALAAPAFLHRHRREAFWSSASPCLTLASAASLSYWHGESAWGPRYLVPIVGLTVLPLAGWRNVDWHGWRRAAVLTAGAAGMVIQLFAVAINYNTYIFETGGPTGPGAEQRWFEPLASPLVEAPQLLVSHIRAALDPCPPTPLHCTQAFSTPRWRPRSSRDGRLARRR